LGLAVIPLAMLSPGWLHADGRRPGSACLDVPDADAAASNPSPAASPATGWLALPTAFPWP
jgi:hypothetical protein